LKVAIYGLPRSGKDHLISQLKDVRHIQGSQWLNERSNGDFPDLPEHEKAILRKEFIGFVNDQNDEHIVVDGHYAFPDKDGEYRVVFTKEDGDCYDKIIYLDAPSSAIIQRMLDSDKNAKYRSLEPKDIDAWKNYEIEGLRKECLSRNKDLIILDSDTPSLLEYFRLILSGSSVSLSFKVAEEIAQDIVQRSAGKGTICLLDCDRTISSNDVTYEFISLAGIKPSVPKDTFGDNRYSSYQFWKMAIRYSEVGEYDNFCQMAAGRAALNTALIDDVKGMSGCYFVGITSGLRKSWESIRQSCGFPDMIVGGSNINTDRWVISDMLKGYVAKSLKKHGKRVVAVGDSMGDRIMLEMADHSYVTAQEKISTSLQAYLRDNHHSIKQPDYNIFKFQGVKVVRSIHEDID